MSECEREMDKPVAVVMYGDAAFHDGAGWYYVEDEYREEGCCGAFTTRDEAVAHAREAGYSVEALDTDRVTTQCIVMP